jgi:hypothetical protein
MQWAISLRLPRSTSVSPSRRQPNARARRRAFFETLETRTVMAPLGAMPDDTGDYMLGDVLVTVVLMESDPTLPGADVSTENWTQASIDAVKSKVQQGMDYWKQTLFNQTGDEPGEWYYNAALPLLDFKYDWRWADNPVETLYEPINRYSSYHELWINDFLDQPDVNFANSLDIYKDVKAFNNFQRETHHTDWAFTIFVANSTNSSDDFFPLNPSPGPGEVNYRGAFAFLGGQFLVIPSDRPATTFAHETGHIFYALDEYSTGHSYYQKAGYYNAQNLNGARDNPQGGFLGVQEWSIMATGTPQQNAWINHVTSASSMATVGWQDTDGDGVLDVVDVPFTLTGTGSYNGANGTYKFKGTSSVQTLKNENTFGGQYTNLLYNDITINKIRRAEYSLDGGDWTTIAEYLNTPTTANLDLTITGITPSAHTIKIRTFDQRTGAASEEFVGTINPVEQPSPPQLTANGGGISGFAFRDDNGNGQWDAGEHPLQDWGVELRNIDDELLTLIRMIEPNDYVESTILNTIQPGITVSVIGATAGGDSVMARTSSQSSNKIFYAASSSHETFTTQRDSTGNNLAVDRRLKAEFNAPVTSVSLKAIGSGTSSVGRLDAFDANGILIGRYTTGVLGAGQSEVMTITHPSADIKYVIASAHLETEVMFDTLIVGPQTATTTNADGSFNLSALPAGTYNLKVVTAPNYNSINPLDGRATITVTPNSSASNNLYFAFQFGGNPWHNLLDPLNTNGNTGITAFDALIIINYLNLHPTGGTLNAGEAVPGQYIDVNNDNMCTAFDALAVINYLNANPIGGGGNQGPEAVAGEPEEPVYEYNPQLDPQVNSGNSGGDGGGEKAFTATTADEYFAMNPLHISQRFKDESHVHVHDDEHDHDHEFESFGHSAADDHDDFFVSLASTSTQNDSDLTAENEADEIFTTTTSPLTSDLLSLVERLRRLKQSADRDGDQLNPRLSAIRTAFGEELDVMSATGEQLTLLRQLLKQNYR